MRQVLFQIHWALGITAGLLLAVIGLTGATMSFETEIMAALNRQTEAVHAHSGPRLSIPAIVDRFYAEHPGTTLTELTVAGDDRVMPMLGYVTGPYDEQAVDLRYVDPYDGELRGEPVGYRFFRTVRQIHRWLLLPRDGEGGSMGVGRWATLITTLALIYFGLSGLYLRWPRRALDWRSWLKIDVRMTGRNLYRSLHTVIGTWLLAFYLLSAFTGLWWSFGERTSWYRKTASLALTGRQYNNPDGDGGFPIPRDFTASWRTFTATYPASYQWARVEVRDRDAPVRVRVLPFGAPHDRAWNTVKIDGKTGKLLSIGTYGQRNGTPMSTGESVLANIIPIHTGSYFGIAGRAALMAASATMPLFTVTGLLLYLGRRRKKRDARPSLAPSGPIVGDGTLLVIYASQTGTAEFIARQTAMAFQETWSPDLVAIDKLDPAVLTRARTALFVVSTYGDGEPPDMARGFARRCLGEQLDLSGLGYGVLALGDREYPDFCRFGHEVDRWLGESGALRLFDTIEADAGDDERALADWQKSIEPLGATEGAIAREQERYDLWRLVERRVLNPDGMGAPAFHVALEPVDACPDWQPGDIARMMFDAPSIRDADPPTDIDHIARPEQVTTLNLKDVEVEVARDQTSTTRDYSIASLSLSGRIELIVRQVRDDRGPIGLGSGWLTHRATIGDAIPLQIRRNPAFQTCEPDRPVLLIGNGTGLAGLLAHVRWRAGIGPAPTWLMLGERNHDHDRFHADEIAEHLEGRTLSRIDYAFSRDPGDGRYVQDLLADAADELAAWLGDDGVIYVCGSLAGMAPAVDAALRRVFGDDGMEQLIAARRYRRDVY